MTTARCVAWTALCVAMCWAILAAATTGHPLLTAANTITLAAVVCRTIVAYRGWENR